jgi:hypothetical protein
MQHLIIPVFGNTVNCDAKKNPQAAKRPFPQGRIPAKRAPSRFHLAQKGAVASAQSKKSAEKRKNRPKGLIPAKKGV